MALFNNFGAWGYALQFLCSFQILNSMDVLRNAKYKEYPTLKG